MRGQFPPPPTPDAVWRAELRRLFAEHVAAGHAKFFGLDTKPSPAGQTTVVWRNSLTGQKGRLAILGAGDSIRATAALLSELTRLKRSLQRRPAVFERMARKGAA